ncbi:dihydroneopterin aldolase [beta proteobacterium MWH-UniP1]
MQLTDPRLSDCRRIFLRDFSIDASIGFHEFEKQAPQRILISVDLFVPIANSTSARDDVLDVVDYDFIRTGIVKIAQSRHFNLQETLIDEICSLCLSQPNVRAARVETQKPDVYPDCKTVGIEVIRWAA